MLLTASSQIDGYTIGLLLGRLLIPAGLAFGASWLYQRRWPNAPTWHRVGLGVAIFVLWLGSTSHPHH